MTSRNRGRTEDRREHWRVFAAVPVNDAVRELMLAIRQDLERQEWTVRWVDPRLAHLTVKFFGDTDPARISELELKLSHVASLSRPFELTTAEFALLGPRRRPNVLSLSVDAAPDDPTAMEQLTCLADLVERQTGGFGSRGNNRPFKAHITLGRFRDRDGAPPGTADVLRALEQPARRFVVDRLQLVRSVLSNEGPTYTTIAEWQLGHDVPGLPANQAEVLEHG